MGNESVRRVLHLSSFSDNIRRLFLKKLRHHDLWARNEILEIFNEAHLEAHMQVLNDFEVRIVEDDETDNET